MSGPAAPFQIGANLPWITYGCDFGANAWFPQGGLSARGVPDAARRALDALAGRGAHVIRWFLFCDGRSGIRFDHDTPIGLDDHLTADVGTALALARSSGLRVMFVLFDFHWCRRGRVVNGVQLGGRQHSMSDPDLRAALIERVITPTLTTFASEPAIAAWDLFNEPEWVTFRLGTWSPFGTMQRPAIRSFIDDVAKCARAARAQPLTVGLASAKWLRLVEGLDLDFYQVHWYDQVEDGRLPRPPAEFAGDRPVVLGEFPTRGSQQAPERLVALAAEAQYAAAWPWSLLADDGATDREAALGAVAADRIARLRESTNAGAAGIA